MNSANSLDAASGKPRAGTFAARAPSVVRNVVAISRIHMKSPAAMKR